MVHADDTDAEDGADERIGRVAAGLQQCGADVAAEGAFGGDGAKVAWRQVWWWWWRGGVGGGGCRDGLDKAGLQREEHGEVAGEGQHCRRWELRGSSSKVEMEM